MAPRTPRGALLAGLLVAFVTAVVVAGQRAEPPPAGVERLGPEFGEPVAAYVRRAWESLPPPGADPAGVGEVWALVELDSYLEPRPAAELIQGVRLSRVVLRVPLLGVQTALIARELPGQRPAAELAAAVRAAGQDRARAAGQAPPGGRLATVAAAESARLSAGCACVLAMLVRADGDALRKLAGRSGVRAVHAASPGTPPQGLSVSPLLPEQQHVVGPVPDDGPVPAQYFHL